MKYANVKPFVKWAGGKSQLLKNIRPKYPENIVNYCEPFVGGGAVLFDILANKKPKKILINDLNSELINTYVQVQNNVDEIIAKLFLLQEDYWYSSAEKRKEAYLNARNKFNNLKINNNEKNNLQKAILFIFLNKTCFNGLYRVNKKGLFNVPIGSYKKPPICDDFNLKIVNKFLQGVQIQSGDYKKCINFIDNNTFVYLDPPYRPLTPTASFTSYNENKFDDNEQVILGKFVDKIAIKGASIIISNSDPKNIDPNDNFFDEIYNKYKIERIQAKRMINSSGKNRGDISELLISNY